MRTRKLGEERPTIKEVARRGGGRGGGVSMRAAETTTGGLCREAVVFRTVTLLESLGPEFFTQGVDFPVLAIPHL